MGSWLALHFDYGSRIRGGHVYRITYQREKEKKTQNKNKELSVEERRQKLQRRRKEEEAMYIH